MQARIYPLEYFDEAGGSCMDSNQMNIGGYTMDNVTEQHIIVGIAIASEHIESFLQFLDHMPPDSGLIYMITTYQNIPIVPLFLDLLSQHTSIPIVNVQDTVHMQVDHIYMIPPERDIVIDVGRLSLVDIQFPNQSMPMDRLFNSLINYSERFVIGILFAGETVDNTRKSTKYA